MWPFSRKAWIPRHKVLISQAEQVLAHFPPHFRTSKSPGDADVYFDLSAVPLEFRPQLEMRLENLHDHVRVSKTDRDNYGKPYLGKAVHMHDLAEDVRFMQVYLSDTFPPQGRLGLRAMAYADHFKAVAEHVKEFEKRGSPDVYVRTSEMLLPIANEVLAWFPDEVALQIAKDALTPAAAKRVVARAAAAALTDKLRAHVEQYGRKQA